MEAAGTIWLETEPVAMQELEEDAVSRALDEQTVVVQIDDEWLAWLARAHLATD
jgi:hypothetical protein